MTTNYFTQYCEANDDRIRLQKEVDKLRAENAILNTVAEAAYDVLEGTPGYELWEPLEKAIKAWKEIHD